MDRKELFGLRLKQARLRAKLSMDALCSKMGGLVSKQSISKYEKGEMSPTSGVLLKFCDALNQDVDFFYRPIAFDSKNLRVSFRKHLGINKKDQDALEVDIQDAVERFIEIDEILNCENSGFKPIEPVAIPISEPKDMVRCAQQVRELWHIGYAPISNIRALLEENGINVIVCDEIDKFDGVSAVVKGKPIMVLNKNVDTTERQRLTAMHELCHILFNDYISPELDDKVKERLCNVFANEMLLPTSVIERYISGRLKTIPYKILIDIQTRYGISIDAIIYKLKDLGIISMALHKSYHKRKNGNESFKHYVEQSRFKEEQISMFESKVYSALAQELITEKKAAYLLKQPVATVHRYTNTI